MPQVFGKMLGRCCEGDPWRLAERLGIDVRYVDVLREETGEVIVKDSGSRSLLAILLPERLRDLARPLAHALAHIIMLHRGNGKRWTEREETAADEFADAFLAETPVATER